MGIPVLRRHAHRRRPRRAASPQARPAVAHPDGPRRRVQSSSTVKPFRTLRARLFIAIAAIVAVSVGSTLAVDGVLTHRAVEHATERDLAHQADLLAGRERASVAPLVHLKSLRAYAASLGERVATVPLDRPSPYLDGDGRADLRSGRSVHGSVEIGSTSYLYAARP